MVDNNKLPDGDFFLMFRKETKLCRCISKYLLYCNQPPGGSSCQLSCARHSPDLQRRAVLRERRAEEGVDGVKHHVDDVFLQDGIRQSLLSFVTHLHRKKRPSETHDSDSDSVSARGNAAPPLTRAMSTVKSSNSFQMWLDV